MAVLKCKMCGGELHPEPHCSICECEYCGILQTIPVIDSEKKGNLFARADRLRSSCDFDKAEGVYESIVAEYPEEAEAYWGLCLCKYGIEYVDDPNSGKKVPTCHRSSENSIFDDPDFDMVMEYCDSASKTIYRNEAKEIEMLRENIMEISSQEEPYDIFICYKETDEEGNRTVDSVIAQEVYEALISKGYKVFFSRISLEDKLGKEYEPYIFAALHSAKIMLVFGTSYDNFTAVWVKNEWSRFLKLMTTDKSKTLICCFKDVDAYDIPKEIRRYQAQDMGKVGATQDLLRGIDKITGKTVTGYASAADQIETILKNKETKNQKKLLKRGAQALGDHDFDVASSYFDQVLDNDLECSDAYFGKLLAIYRFSTVQEFAGNIVDRMFQKTWVTVKPECSVMDALQKQFKYYTFIDPVSKAVLENTHMKFFARQITDDEESGAVGFLNKYMEQTDAPLPVQKLFEHFLEYYKPEEQHMFSMELLNNSVEASISKDKNTYDMVREKCSREQILKAIQDIPDPVESYIENLKAGAVDKVNKNKEKINTLESEINKLSGLSGIKKKKELRNQIIGIQKKNEKLQNDIINRNIPAEEVLWKISVGKFLRTEFIKQGYIEEFPEDREFELGRWKNAAKEMQPIRWSVIGKEEEEGCLLLLAVNVLDVIQYASNMKEITWPASDLRRFLNKTFYESAFTESERKIIVPVCMDASQGSEEYKDNVFCLSSGEYSDYIPKQQNRKTQFTAYAAKQIGKRKEPLIWTRDNGVSSDGKKVGFVMIDCNGTIMPVDNLLGKEYGIRPALWIDIS